MLKDLQLDSTALTAAFNQAIKNNTNTRFCYIHVTVQHTPAAGGTLDEQLKRIEDLVACYKDDILETLNGVGALGIAEVPRKFLNKVYPQIGFWVPADKAHDAAEALKEKSWCAKVKTGPSWHPDDSGHRADIT